jgi:hypothetical protein
MPTVIVIDKNQRTAFVRRTGRIQRGEMLKATKELEADPFYDSLRKLLFRYKEYLVYT